MDKKHFACYRLNRRHVEYAHSVWYPYKNGNIADMEKVPKNSH